MDAAPLPGYNSASDSEDASFPLFTNAAATLVQEKCKAAAATAPARAAARAASDPCSTSGGPVSITAVSSHPSPRRAHLPSSTQTPPSSPWKGQSLEEARGELLRQVQSLDQLAWVDFGSINGLRPEWWPAHKVSVKELFRRNAYHRYKGREICPFPSAPSPPPGLAHPATPRSDHILGAPFGPSALIDATGAPHCAHPVRDIEGARWKELENQQVRLAAERSWFSRAVQWLRDATATARQREVETGTHDVDRAAREMASQRKREAADEHHRIRSALAEHAGPLSPPRPRHTRVVTDRPHRAAPDSSGGPAPRLRVGDKVEYFSESRDEMCTEAVVHIERSHGLGSEWRVHTLHDGLGPFHIVRRVACAGNPSTARTRGEARPEEQTEGLPLRRWALSEGKLPIADAKWSREGIATLHEIHDAAHSSVAEELRKEREQGCAAAAASSQAQPGPQRAGRREKGGGGGAASGGEGPGAQERGSGQGPERGVRPTSPGQTSKRRRCE